MVPRQAYPPSHHHAHLTRTISPAEACSQLSDFLSKSQSEPYLHPGSVLSATGVTYAPTSGPRGGLAIHHLGRIAAGLRGDNLAAETQEELDAQFGDSSSHEQLKAGDDAVLDELITETERKQKRESKRKRQHDDIEEWAVESSSQAGVPEIESFANTPMHHSDWQDQEDYEQQQQALVGEVGERGGAPAVKQNGAVPAVVEHDEDGDIAMDTPKTNTHKAARRAAKKAKRLQEKREKIAEVQREKG